MTNCVHANQKFVSGVWVCRSCKEQMKPRRFDASKLDSIMFGGLHAFRQFRDLGMSEARMTKDNIERFRKEKGYDPVREGERWI